ncbi:alpha/beta hydrolase [Microbacterium sp. M28]|uniref:alpha/beta fold hydrolase n=1 Tax=Microbacterium sp. M28 TaxID=2962064 RepID=UPI0021F4C194|nr:alpha/beta hydrolase [Microbacterium sp. M28]UYO95648.1 alpha/beta hydrolase [Microbacterium sp. M28]
MDTTHISTVTSADGTAIAYERIGTGPVIIVISNVAEDRTGVAGIADALAADFTVISYDRRGRGESGDPQPYEPAREIDDIAALVDAVGSPVFLTSGSGGCGLALDAASALGDAVAGVYLYEPPFIVDDSRAPAPADYVAHQEELVAAGRRDEAVEYFMSEMIGVPEEYLPLMKDDPSWQEMVRYAHTYAYDGRIMQGLQDGAPLPRDRWRIDAPIAVAVGSNGEGFIRAGAQALAALLPHVTVLTLEGQDHSAFWMAPEPVAEQIRGFLLTEGSDTAAAVADEPRAPGADMVALDRLVGEWTVTGGAVGVVRYEWMPGRHFLIQHVDLEQFGEQITGLEVIGHLRPFGEPAGADVVSRFYDSLGNTLDYTYELEGDVLTIWGGAKGSPAYFRGEFTDGDRVMAGAWVYPGGGGYASTMTRR